MPETTSAGKSVLIAGAGNIGSHLAPLIMRLGVGDLRLVDRDRVEAKNLATQDYQPGDEGRYKADVLAERLRRQFPGRSIRAWACDLEDLPLGEAAVDVLLGALDSRRARQVLVSEMGWPLGVPVVDGGVGEGLVGRVQVFIPGPEAACLECTWGREDYRQLAAEYPCVPGAAAGAPPTVSPAFQGSFVASLMAAECGRVLAGEAPAESYELPFDLRHHQLRHYRLRRATGCRHDHEVVGETVPLAVTATVGELLGVVGRLFGAAPVRLEARRRLHMSGEMAMTRFIRPERLHERRGERLTVLGLAGGDRLRVRDGRRSVFLALVDVEDGARL